MPGLLAHAALRLGAYLVVPTTRALHNGWFGSFVSIRHDSLGSVERVLSLTRLFRDHSAAAAYGRQEGLRWLRAPNLDALLPSPIH